MATVVLSILGDLLNIARLSPDCTIESSEKARHMTDSLDAAEAALRFEQSGGNPANRHRTVTPPPNIPRDTTNRSLKVLDWIRRAQQPIQRAGDAEPE